MKRYKTKYPGVFYREVTRIGGKGIERVFYVVFKKAGKVCEEKVGRQYADDMTEAKAARIRGERIEGKRQSRKEIRQEKKKKNWTIENLWTEFEKEKKLKSIKMDKSRFDKYIKPHVGSKEPQQIAPLDIERLTRKGLKGKSPQTVKLTLSLLRRIVNFGVKTQRSGRMTFNLEMPEVNNIVIEDLNQDQIKKLMKAIDDDPCPEVAAVMSIALFSGMRRGEILSLRWDDVDFDRGFIAIKNPKGGQDATIPLNESVRQVLEKITQGKSPYVFPGREGKKRHDIRRGANRIKKAAGLPEDFRPLHGLRHVYASMLASSGRVDLYTLQKLLTHKDPKTTQRYAHLRDDALRKASDLAGDLVREAVAQGKA
ncbi:MAG: site-specific integrase [Deltaproteobacteria bacterium]|nr:site-specific integrase [Deltaproteobacteria bacterium]